jgi:hypothetical protein
MSFEMTNYHRWFYPTAIGWSPRGTYTGDPRWSKRWVVALR